jgi:hypothetical protein
MSLSKKYFRCVRTPTNPIFSLWHEVTEETAIQSVKLGIPRNSWFLIPRWFEEGIVLGNAFAFYRKGTDAFIQKMNGVIE